MNQIFPRKLHVFSLNYKFNFTKFSWSKFDTCKIHVYSFYSNYSEVTSFLTGSENIVDPGEPNIRSANDLPSLSVSTVESESVIEIEGKEPSESNFEVFSLWNNFFVTF